MKNSINQVITTGIQYGDAIALRRISMTPYVQGDPRGCALYILRPNDVPTGKDADAYYSRGVPVF